MELELGEYIYIYKYYIPHCNIVVSIFFSIIPI